MGITQSANLQQISPDAEYGGPGLSANRPHKQVSATKDMWGKAQSTYN